MMNMAATVHHNSVMLAHMVCVKCWFLDTCNKIGG